MSNEDSAKKLFALQRDLAKLSKQMDSFIKDLIRKNIEEEMESGNVSETK